MLANVLVLNAGSSSLKFALFRAGATQAPVVAGAIENIGQPGSVLKLKPPAPGDAQPRPVCAPDHAACLTFVFDALADVAGEYPPGLAAHRIVHGGPRYFDPHGITPELLEELRRLSPYDPEHLPAEIALIEAVAARNPDLPQVACFDTAFHRDLPRLARMFPLPRRYEAAGVRRYGFHGLSYAFLMQELVRLGDLAATAGRVVLAHLGNGASLAAVRNGRCVDTSMGFTPASGLMMGTRSGDLDPGLVSYLARTENMSPAGYQKLVNHESGLLGVSETSSDMRALLAAEEQDPRAAEAVGLFCYQARKWLGAFAAVLGGLDTLVFAGGIGENCPSIRRRICEDFEFLGLKLDDARNRSHTPLVSAVESRVAVRLMHTNEERMIAEAATKVWESKSSTTMETKPLIGADGR